MKEGVTEGEGWAQAQGALSFELFGLCEREKGNCRQEK